MKYSFISQLVTLVAVFMLACLGEFASALLPETSLLAEGVTLASATGLLVNLFNKDPKTWIQWEREAFKQGEAKTEFNESEIGTTFANDGPLPSQQTIAAPILYHTGHEAGGRTININYDEPLFSDTETILNAGRYQSQDRNGYEHKMNVRSVKAIVDEHHLGVREDQVESGEQFTANSSTGEVMSAFVDKITDFDATRGDLELFYSFFAGYSKNTVISTCVRKSVSNGSNPVADPDSGHMFAMGEHPDTLVYHMESDAPKLTKVAYDADAATFKTNFLAALSDVTPDAAPGLDFLNRVRNHARSKHMIPCSLRLEDGKLKEYFLLYVSDRVKTLIEKDSNAFELYVKAYQGMVGGNPLLQEGDMLYKNLIIRESKRLNEDFFSAKKSFFAADADFNIVDGGIKDGVVNVTEGENDFVSESPGESAYGVQNTQLVGRCMLLGANALIKCAGKSFSMAPMEITQQGRDSGLARTKFYGCQRIQNYTPGSAGLAFNAVPQSAQILVHQGD